MRLNQVNQWGAKEISFMLSELEQGFSPEGLVGAAGFSSVVDGDATSSSSVSYVYEGDDPFNASGTYCYDKGWLSSSKPSNEAFSATSLMSYDKNLDAVTSHYYYGQRSHSTGLSFFGFIGY